MSVCLCVSVPFVRARVRVRVRVPVLLLLLLLVMAGDGRWWPVVAGGGAPNRVGVDAPVLLTQLQLRVLTPRIVVIGTVVSVRTESQHPRRREHSRTGSTTLVCAP